MTERRGVITARIRAIEESDAGMRRSGGLFAIAVLGMTALALRMAGPCLAITVAGVEMTDAGCAIELEEWNPVAVRC